MIEYVSSNFCGVTSAHGKMKVSFGKWNGIDLTKAILILPLSDPRRQKVLDNSSGGGANKIQYDGTENIIIGGEKFTLQELESNYSAEEKAALKREREQNIEQQQYLKKLETARLNEKAYKKELRDLKRENTEIMERIKQTALEKKHHAYSTKLADGVEISDEGNGVVSSGTHYFSPSVFGAGYPKKKDASIPSILEGVDFSHYGTRTSRKIN